MLNILLVISIHGLVSWPESIITHCVWLYVGSLEHERKVGHLLTSPRVEVAKAVSLRFVVDNCAWPKQVSQ